ncbi:hypothetical protein BJY52DRAFT_1420014 [Lactarius psammicola]|nr:hypothetical protein BJY52DRAFT_1420014 [Lactarius psammicola]
MLAYQQGEDPTIQNCSCERCSDVWPTRAGPPTWYPVEQRDPRHFSLITSSRGKNAITPYPNLQNVNSRAETTITVPDHTWAQVAPPQTAGIQDNFGYAPPERAGPRNVGLLQAPMLDASLAEGRRRLAGRYLNNPDAFEMKSQIVRDDTSDINDDGFDVVAFLDFVVLNLLLPIKSFEFCASTSESVLRGMSAHEHRLFSKLVNIGSKYIHGRGKKVSFYIGKRLPHIEVRVTSLSSMLRSKVALRAYLEQRRSLARKPASVKRTPTSTSKVIERVGREMWKGEGEDGSMHRKPRRGGSHPSRKEQAPHRARHEEYEEPRHHAQTQAWAAEGYGTEREMQAAQLDDGDCERLNGAAEVGEEVVGGGGSAASVALEHCVALGAVIADVNSSKAQAAVNFSRYVRKIATWLM